MTDPTVPPFDVDAEPETAPPTSPPPGTSAPTFWQSGGTKAALVITLGCAVDVAWAWGGAFGLSQWDTDALRWR